MAGIQFFGDSQWDDAADGAFWWLVEEVSFTTVTHSVSQYDANNTRNGRLNPMSVKIQKNCIRNSLGSSLDDAVVAAALLFCRITRILGLKSFTV